MILVFSSCVGFGNGLARCRLVCLDRQYGECQHGAIVLAIVLLTGRDPLYSRPSCLQEAFPNTLAITPWLAKSLYHWLIKMMI